MMTTHKDSVYGLDIIETLEFEHGVKAFILPDDDAACLHPREDCDNLSVMVCWHRRYRLGDEHKYQDPGELWADLIEESLDDAKVQRILQHILDTEDGKTDYESRGEQSDLEFVAEWYRQVGASRHWDEVVIPELQEHGYTIKPLYLYDHSGLSISTGSFSCPWDSGQLGWMYVGPKQIEKMGTPPELVEKCIEGEVEEYDQYLRGEVYGYRVETPDEEDADTCWGHIGLDWAKEAATDAANYYVKQYGDPDRSLGEGI